MTGPLTLVCMLVADVSVPVRDATEVPCSTCTAPCWVAPSSVPVLGRARVLCSRCARHQIKPTDEFGGLLPGQLQEMRDELQRDLFGRSPRDDTDDTTRV